MDRFEAVETRGDDHVGGRVATDDGARLWVDVHGRGRPLLLVHGWGTSSAFWRRQSTLAGRFQVITFDLRGHGRSNPVLRGHDVPRLARDLRDVLRALDLDRAVALGWSLGGSVVLEYWRAFGGERLAALGVVETCPFPFSDDLWNTHRYRGGDEDAMNADLCRMAADRRGYGGRFVDGMFLAGRAPDHAGGWMLEEHLKTDPRAAAALYRDYVRRDYRGVLPTIALPALALYGRSRHHRFGATIGQFVAGSIPGAHLVELEHSGHLPFYEEADPFNHALTEFLRTLP